MGIGERAQQPPEIRWDCYYRNMMINNNSKASSTLRRMTVFIASAWLLAFGGLSHAEGRALVLEIDDAIGVATADYIITGLEKAADSDAALVIIKMDTPGGLVEPMRDIVKAILGSPVPVVTYVTPGGARADSAGTYILLASHVAAMAPTTHLGAATPVSLGGDGPSPPLPLKDRSEEQAEEPAPVPDGDAMSRKILNDAISYIRGLAEAHGRNAEWAEKAVREAATLTAEEAVAENVADLIAADIPALLEAIDGREVLIKGQPAILETSGLTLEEYDPGWRIKILSTITHPEIALLLLLVGIYGLVFEGWNPGAILPGVAGVICLLLAAYALQIIPVNYAGLALIIVGLLLIVAEAFVPSFGALGFGGIAAFVFGAIMMFDTGVPGFGISLTFVIGFGLISGLFLFWLISYLLRLTRRGPVSGLESMIGRSARAMSSFTGSGLVWMDGESWSAVCDSAVDKDQMLKVTRTEGLTLYVEPLPRKNGQ